MGYRFKRVEETEFNTMNGASVTVEKYTCINTQENFVSILYDNDYLENVQCVGLLEVSAVENLVKELNKFLDANK